MRTRRGREGERDRARSDREPEGDAEAERPELIRNQGFPKSDPWQNLVKNLVSEIGYFVIFLICKGGTLISSNYNH